MSEDSLSDETIRLHHEMGQAMKKAAIAAACTTALTFVLLILIPGAAHTPRWAKLLIMWCFAAPAGGLIIYVLLIFGVSFFFLAAGVKLHPGDSDRIFLFPAVQIRPRSLWAKVLVYWAWWAFVLYVVAFEGWKLLLSLLLSPITNGP